MSPDPLPSLAHLPRGHRFSAVAFRLSAADVRRYLEAVEDASPLYLRGEGGAAWVPPLAAAAFALKAVMDQTRLPPGSLHAAQELEFRRPVPAGSELTLAATVAQRSEMRGMAVCVIEFEVGGAEGEGPAVIGRSTVMAPLEEASAD